jgi:hypothetical protein
MTASQSTNPLATALPNAGSSFAVQEGEIGPNQIGSTATKVGFLQFTAVTYTAAQIIAMYATPQSLVAAPAAGLSIVPRQTMIRFTYPASGGVQFTGGGVVAPQIGNSAHGAGTLFTTTLAAAVITAAASADTLLASTGANVTLVQSTGSNATAAGLYMSNATAAFAAGNGTMTVFQWYTLN